MNDSERNGDIDTELIGDVWDDDVLCDDGVKGIEISFNNNGAIGGFINFIFIISSSSPKSISFSDPF